MTFFNSVSASAVLTLLSCIPLATSQRTLNEHPVLADCGNGHGPDGGLTSREVLYYNSHLWTGNGDETNNLTMAVNVLWWECSGDPAIETLDKMASVFEELSKFTKEREVTTEVCRSPDTRPGREALCRLYETKVDKYFKMPSTIELVMRNLPKPGSGDYSNEHGRMKYTVKCEASVWECVLCKGIGKALSIPVPSVGFAVWLGCTAC
ncbi:hypothetical protein NCS52_01528600 [Fusarium sp. LHS14.1]|nr:hypothetical protein NCS52_01528600 [Fusarium sp. LHS14.1]